MSNIEYQTQSHIQILNVEYRISNSIKHSNRMSNIEYQTQSHIQIELNIENKINIQIECRIWNIKLSIQIDRISNIKLNPTFKSNVEYRISNSISYSNFECRISNIKLNQTFKSNVEYRISNSISNSNFECRISNIKLNPTFKSNVEYRISNSIQHSNSNIECIEYQTYNRMSNIDIKLNQTKSNFQIEHSNQTKSNIQIEYRISNSISHSNFECRISNIKLNQTFKSMSNIEYQTQSHIQIDRMSNMEYQTQSHIQIESQHSNRMSNIEYQTQHSNFECRISNIKLNPTFKSNVEYRISNIQIECRISNIKLNPTFKSKVEYRISN